ncbi:hypothetical protein AAC387_Pa02g4847 [Persea americana]|eukprot:TRINITY_DN91399_c2_g1_i1.p1 TRINITY_DN91399_c2_g1~~TRINITY_DN91399_c2_g1_i1.p1  ORF type:complete len:312 (+),score=51.45 TRINITY_DN91399_c2_g1_i1:294-1229(+)
MEFPFGHHHGRHERRREDEEEEERQNYPPPEYRPPSHPFRHEHEYTETPEYHRPPPPPHHHQSHERFEEEGYERHPPPPPPSYGGYSDYPPAPHNYHRPPPPSEPAMGYSSVHHVAHESGGGFESDPSGFGREEPQRRHGAFSIFHHHKKESEGSGVVNKPTVRVYCKAETNYSLSIMDGKVILARSDPNDEFQHWIKDEKYSTRVKDEEGFPSFALVNKATGQAIKHSIGATHPVQLCPYDADVLDESVLWAESRDTGDGYRAVRMVNNIRLNFDAFHGDKNHGGVHDGTTLVLWEWKKGDNQRWKIVSY